MAFATHTIRNLKFASIYFWRINHSTTVYYIHICENQVLRENVFASFVISTNSTTICAGMYWIGPCKNLILAIHQFNHCLWHTYKWNPVLRENTFARIGISTNSTTRCAGICWMEPREEIVSKDWPFNHLKSFCNTHNSKIEVCEYLLLANQPFNHCLLHTYLWKSGFARNCFCEDWQFNHFNH